MRAGQRTSIHMEARKLCTRVLRRTWNTAEKGNGADLSKHKRPCVPMQTLLIRLATRNLKDLPLRNNFLSLSRKENSHQLFLSLLSSYFHDYSVFCIPVGSLWSRNNFFTLETHGRFVYLRYCAVTWNTAEIR